MNPLAFPGPAAVYGALAAVLDKPAAELARTIPLRRALALLRYHRRQAGRRAAAEALARLQGVSVAEVYLSCVPSSSVAWLTAIDDEPAARHRLPAGA